ncbi:hypothetical protein IC620_10985 [Hazenella sp. IB182357]|uniref:Tetratricopeptide repeat protein n=1 Tax=Polycladospora coralii TaxID=2771432 RepID=A0A926NBS1_9BACL|nr:hypothetical protein [Polycladospora coralii]MBD1372880.1 hypothetical protein [Polycladospora coralii]
MLQLVQAWYYAQEKNWVLFEKMLLHSIDSYSNHVQNYVSLGIYYIDIGRIDEGKALLDKSIKNVKKIYSDNDSILDRCDPEEFINERIKGIHKTDILVNAIKNRINEE